MRMRGIVVCPAGEAQSWGSDYFGGKVVPGAAAQPVEVQGEGLCWGGHLGGDYVTGAALRPGEVKGTNIRISVFAGGCPHSPVYLMSRYPCPQRVVHRALRDQCPDIRVHRGLST